MGAFIYDLVFVVLKLRFIVSSMLYLQEDVADGNKAKVSM